MSSLIRNMLALFASLVACLLLGLLTESGLVQAGQSPPTAYTGQATVITLSSATLAGSTYPNNQETAYYFQYGQTTAYGLQTQTTGAGGGKQTIHVVAALSGLATYTTYHYRLVAVNAAGTTYGQDRSFTTKKVPLTFTVLPLKRQVYGTPISVSGTLAGTGSGSEPVILQANPFPFLGGFKDVGSQGVTDAEGGFSFEVGAPLRNTQFRVSTVEQTPVKSRVVVALVAVRVTLHVRGAGRPGFVRFFGTIAPAQPGATVQLQRIGVGGRSSTVGGTLVTSRDRLASRFSSRLRVRHRGFYRADVRVVSGAQVSNQSRPILLR
jgi:hypothetical protein